jgi:hypothetical protein
VNHESDHIMLKGYGRACFCISQNAPAGTEENHKKNIRISEHLSYSNLISCRHTRCETAYTVRYKVPEIR